MRRYLAPAFVCAAAIVAGTCGGGPGAVTQSPDSRVRELADTDLGAYFERFPEQITYFGVPGRPQSGLTDNSLTALRAWEAREDGFLASLKTDRSVGDWRRAAARHLRDRPPDARSCRGQAGLSRRTVERQRDDRLAGQLRLPRDD